MKIALLPFLFAILVSFDFFGQASKSNETTALNFMRNKQFFNAISYYNQELSINPNNLNCLKGRGVCFLETKQYELAIIDFNKYIQLHQDAEVYLYLGESYHFLNNFQEAISAYNKAIAYNPQLSIIYGDRGRAFFAKGDDKSAQSDFEFEIKLKPDNYLPYYHLGLIYENRGEISLAIKFYSKSIQLNGSFFSSINNRGLCYMSINDLDKAILDLDKAILLKPEYPNGYYNKGLILFKKEKVSEAKFYFNKTLEIDNKFSQAYLNRGLCNYILGDQPSACRDIKMAKTLGVEIPADLWSEVNCK